MKTVIKVLMGFMLLTCCFSTVQASTIWAPMWDSREGEMTWEVKASKDFFTAYSYNVGASTITITDSDNNFITSVSGDGDVQVTASDLAAGEIYKVNVAGDLHYRMHWDEIDWARLGRGSQEAGPYDSTGFQSDAALGFDARWDDLDSQFSDTTWYYNVGANETLSVSAEHVTGEESAAFSFISPSGVETVADADGLPGAGYGHWPARGGLYDNAPDVDSVYWDEYIAPTSEEGLWGFKLYAIDGTPHPYAFHYILDRTDAGLDQYAYLYADSMKSPDTPIPEPSTFVLMCLGIVILGMTLRSQHQR